MIMLIIIKIAIIIIMIIINRIIQNRRPAKEPRRAGTPWVEREQ